MPEATALRSPSTPDWNALAERARTRRRMTQAVLYAILIVTSLPVVLPYFWMVTISFSATSGSTDTFVLWRSIAILVPTIFVIAGLQQGVADPRRRRRLRWAVIAVAFVALLAFVAPHLHVHNYRYLWNPDIVEDMRGRTGAGGGQFPWVWTAFGNSLLLAGAQTLIVVTVSTLAGYYISRFSFAGREGFLKSLLVLHAFPAMTLIIPIFLILHWTGLLDTLTGVVLVICTLELPFSVFIMKGFFDTVPWEVEMSAITDGASRRQAFFKVVLPQVRVGLIAVGIFAFIKGWEEYVFVATMLFEKANWVMSLYLFWVADDIMGVDYGIVAAVGVFYVIPSLVLYLTTQKYLTQMTLGGIKG